MTDDPRGAAHSHRYGRPPWLERAGTVIGRWIGDGPVRRTLRAGFRGALGLLTGGSLRSVLPHGEIVRVAPELRFITWNPVEYEAFRAVLRLGDSALDIGANVGAYTVLFGQWVGNTGRVLAFEPAPAAFAGLRRQIALNGLDRHVHPAQVAISDATGEAAFVSEGVQGTNHLGAAVGDASTVIHVPTTTLDEICGRERLRPRLIKIDVEGAELAVLRGAQATIAAMGQDAGLFVEMHPAAWRGMGLSVDDMLAELTRQNLRAVPLRETGDPWALDGECMRLVRA